MLSLVHFSVLFGTRNRCKPVTAATGVNPLADLLPWNASWSIAFAVNGALAEVVDGVVEKVKLWAQSVSRLNDRVEMAYSIASHTSLAVHSGLRTLSHLSLVNTLMRPRRVDSASLKRPRRLISL